MEIFGTVLLFITILLFTILIFQVFRALWNPEARRVRRELQGTAATASKNAPMVIRRKKELSGIPWLNRMLSNVRAPIIRWFDQLLQQSNTHQPLGVYVLCSLVLALAGSLIAGWLGNNFKIGLPAGALAAMLPFFFLTLKRNRRMRKFEEQLPDALNLIARALKAGQAFPTGLQMVAQEFDDPIGSEFEKMLAQINLGVGFPEALKGLTERVSCPDIKFFAISVIIQRQSGGSLAEILENISRLIRERFKLRGHIQALSAEGRISAVILVALPFCLFGLMSLINPEYSRILLTDPRGVKLALGALVMMGMGILVMRKMIRIKV
ncbi:MAG: type II secretion system F family protein [bacterium]